MKYLIGIDGGGTSTRAALFELTPEGPGRRIRQAESGSSNLNSNTEEQVRQNLADLFRALNPQDAVATGCGIAGVSTPGVTEQIARILSETGYPEPHVVVGDYETALRGALGRSPGVLLIAGTGSIAYGQARDGQLFRSGGYGHLISDGGSAYDIGRALLAAYVQAIDGAVTKTPLLEALEQELGGPQDALGKLLNLAYAVPFDKSRIAALARLLDPYIAAEDPAALKIAAEGAGALKQLVETAARPLKEDTVHLVPAGGMLLHNKNYRAELERVLRDSDIRYVFAGAQADAMAGAADMAWEAWEASL